MLIPYGMVMAYAGEIFEVKKESPNYNFAPTSLNKTGWLLCNGDEILQSMFPYLVNVIRDIYGGSFKDGKVNLPDYRGYFLRGCSMSLGKSGRSVKEQDPGLASREAVGKGEASGVGSSQSWMIQDHSHKYINYPPLSPCFISTRETCATRRRIV
ncbi:MAG: phage tail protein, partial [Bacteroidota bacterium]